MSFDYSKSATSATRLFTKFGQDVVHSVYSSGEYDTDTSAADSNEVPVTRKGVLLDLGSNGVTHIRGNLVEVSDKQLLLDAQAGVALEDLFTANSKEYQVVSIGELNPAGTSVMYDLHVRAS